MMRTVLAGLVFFTLASTASAQDTSTVTGTWDVNLMSHQIALVLEQDGTAVTGTMMMMGKDIEMNGEFTDGKLSLTGEGGFGRPDSSEPPTPIRLTGTMKKDGTLDGELPMPQGAMKWTAERLNKKK